MPDTSARNQLLGRVAELRPGAVNADVLLVLDDGTRLSANITNAALQQLGLISGDKAWALIDASHIMIAPGREAAVSVSNRLAAVIKGIQAGAVRDQVTLSLACGGSLVVGVTRGCLQSLGLAEGADCCALFSASSVVLMSF